MYVNAHSLLNDTEMNVVTDAAELARDTRLRLWAEHLETDVASIADLTPHAVIDELFKPIAAESRAEPSASSGRSRASSTTAEGRRPALTRLTNEANPTPESRATVTSD
jgi:hypothetical protein